MERQKSLFLQWFSSLFDAELNKFMASSAVYLCGRFQRNHCFPCCNTWESSSNHLELGAKIIHCWFTVSSFRWGPMRRGSCKWDTLCGRGTAPTWSQCRITGTWQWPRWRRGPLSLWRQWTPWLVHVSATLYPADDSPTRQRRKSSWRSSTLNCPFPTNTLKASD